jgi:hypothetical protein
MNPGTYYADGRTGTCPACGKQGYVSRKMAKKGAARLYPGEKMSVYQCGDLWHYGHLPKVVQLGKKPRSQVRSRDRRPRMDEAS